MRYEEGVAPTSWHLESRRVLTARITSSGPQSRNRTAWVARFLRQRAKEFGRAVPAAPHRPSPATWNDNAVTLAWLGHATVLINFYGVRILTDPVLFSRIGVNLG